MQVVLFAVPGAFTPTCSSKHLPGFIEKVEEFKAKGVDTIACVSVNDAFVMQAWGKTAGIDGKILMLADGSADFAKVVLNTTDAARDCFGCSWRPVFQGLLGPKRWLQLFPGASLHFLFCLQRSLNATSWFC